MKDSVIKFDLRGELGVAVELSRQAVPVIANECIVRSFYFIRRFAMEMKENEVRCFADMKKIDLFSLLLKAFEPRHLSFFLLDSRHIFSYKAAFFLYQEKDLLPQITCFFQWPQSVSDIPDGYQREKFLPFLLDV